MLVSISISEQVAHGFQPAVSQGFQPASDAAVRVGLDFGASADWKSAIQQAASLRYAKDEMLTNARPPFGIGIWQAVFCQLLSAWNILK
jgi:hypothetical protein